MSIRGIIRAAVLGLSALTCWTAAGCSDDSNLIGRDQQVTVGVTIEDGTGLLGFEQVQDDMFMVEFMPDADQSIYGIDAEYYLGNELVGNEYMVTEDGSWFGRENVILRAFSTKDLEDPEDIPPFTVHLSFFDEAGTVHEALNDYFVRNPQTGGQYLIMITGNAESGYRLGAG